LPRLKDILIVLTFGAFFAAFAVGMQRMPEKPALPDPQIQALQEQVNQLQTRLDEVENVQGYIALKNDWRSKR
jgi:hypothetical protein